MDDAAGEAFDKAARLLGLGYPGGPAIERAADGGDPEAFEFPVAMSDRGLDFSFSGLKTSLVYRVRDLGPEEAERRRADLAASFQRGDRRPARREARARRARPASGPRSRWAAGWLRTPSSASAPQVLCGELGLRLKLVADLALHGQRGDDRSAARFSEPIPYPDYLGFDAFATGSGCTRGLTAISAMRRARGLRGDARGRPSFELERGRHRVR